jgi:hypothetical protein
MNGVCAPEEGAGRFKSLVSAYFLVYAGDGWGNGPGGREQLGKRLYAVLELRKELEGSGGWVKEKEKKATTTYRFIVTLGHDPRIRVLESEFLNPKKLTCMFSLTS